MKKYKIFDAHTHAFPQKIAAQTMEFLSAKAGIPYLHDGSFGDLKAYEKNGGADAYLILPIATKAGAERTVNECAASEMSENVLAFGSIHPDCSNIPAELDRVVSLGLKGIKLHPEYQDFFADDEKMFKIYDEIFARNLPICFHAGVDLGFDPPIHGSPKRLAAVAKKFPHGKIIAAHMGGYQQFDGVCEHLAGLSNVWMDTSFASTKMKADEIVHLVRLHGADKFLFGTDAPWRSFDESLDSIVNSGLSGCEIADILWHNAAKLLKF